MYYSYAIPESSVRRELLLVQQLDERHIHPPKSFNRTKYGLLQGGGVDGIVC